MRQMRGCAPDPCIHAHTRRTGVCSTQMLEIIPVIQGYRIQSCGLLVHLNCMQSVDFQR